jgi:hypothetical protein
MKKVMIFPFFYIIVLLILGTLYLIWPNTLSLIKVTEIGLSWPVLLVIFLCYFICIYYNPIYDYLKELRSIKTPWGETLRQEKATETNSSKIEMAAYKNIVNALFEEKKEYINKAMEKDQKINLSEKKAVDWMFAYANIFLIYKTKVILETICNRERMDIESFNKLCLSMKINEKENNNIVSALTGLHFIFIDKNSYNITPLGKYYVNYMRSTKQI